MSDIEIDGRELFPPEPMVKVMDALARLPPGSAVRLLLPREPFPLFEVLRREGYRWTTVSELDGTFVITIRHAE